MASFSHFSLLLFLAHAVLALPPGCHPSCLYSTSVKGVTYSFDFAPLCNAASDYTTLDAQGHAYAAQVCGTARQQCLPSGWLTQYDYGAVVQSWGAPPPCAGSPPPCVSPESGAPQCCTGECSVVGISSGVTAFRPLDAGNAGAGFELVLVGETPTASDPYMCERDPSTLQPYPRVTHMRFTCDTGQRGFARLVGASQNDTDNCEYFLDFKTSLVCVNAPLSGGWAFLITLGTLAAAYLAVYIPLENALLAGKRGFHVL
jgi:hypothetical protein